MEFKLKSNYKPTGDQPRAIKQLCDNLINKNIKHNVLLGATGTGKTFTVANVISSYNKPTLIMAQNKTLANQLYLELKGFFPDNRVEYYISNFDFYQPEAYLPTKDMFIEKQSVQNWQIEMMRMSALNALVKRPDTIVIASVAAIYGLREPEEYKKHHLELVVGESIKRQDLLYKLVSIRYKRNDIELKPGSFSAKGDVINIAPGWTDQYHISIELFGDLIEEINQRDSLNKNIIKSFKKYTIDPADSSVLSKSLIKNGIKEIKKDLVERVDFFEKNNLLLEKQRIEQRTNFDIEQLEEFGTCSGIENYSIYFEPWRKSGEPPATLFDYFPKDFLLVIDESHISLPQIRGMYEGDKSRKSTLVHYGFRLPKAMDNRPLEFKEFTKKTDKVIYVSATPADYEMDKSTNSIVEQIIRPTGLLDPVVEIRKEENQIDDLIEEIHKRKKVNERVFINTVTIKLSEDVAKFLNDKGLSVTYLHSELKTFERNEVIRKLRLGHFDAIVGINLLREGLDVPEVSMIAILDANKEGFLRNTRSLIQMMGRVARNVNGKVIMYSDTITRSMKEAIDETARRRNIQIEYNKKHNIEPKTIIKEIPESLTNELESRLTLKLNKTKLRQRLSEMEIDMTKAAKNLDFEKAIKLRDLITELKS